jgi:acetolactate synthase-1/2/3 large subunit
MKASDYVAYYLEAQGVSCVFELVGGMITHLLDSVSRLTSVRLVSCHHEQGAGFAAEGFARVNGIPGVALATSGPGATNLLTSIASCYYDSTPVIFITGQVNTYELKGSTGVRQLGFQETDIVSMASPVCKLAIQVKQASDLPEILKTAFKLAQEGRQGPCLIDIPMNVQSDDLPDDLAQSSLFEALHRDQDLIPSEPNNRVPDHHIAALLQAISIAERPLLLLGGGAASFQNRDAAIEITELLSIPVVLSLMAVDILDCDNPLRVGFIGSYGNRWANKILGESDLLLVIGSRLDIRQTGSNIRSFCEGKRIWQVDIDSSEIGARILPDSSILSSIQEFASSLKSYHETSSSINAKNRPLWNKRIIELKNKYPADLEYFAEGNEVNPVTLIQTLSAFRLKRQIFYVTDVGQHQMWAAQCTPFKLFDRFLTSGGMGAMGFGLPAAIGAAMANRNATIVLITGDGSFQLNIQELETLRLNNLNLKVILFNNQCHGMVRQFQDSYFNSNHQSTINGYSAPDFEKISKAYGISAMTIHNRDDVASSLGEMFSDRCPFLLQVTLSRNSKVYPKLAFGRTFGEMEPDVNPVAMEST